MFREGDVWKSLDALFVFYEFPGKVLCYIWFWKCHRGGLKFIIKYEGYIYSDHLRIFLNTIKRSTQTGVDGSK
jgi:hypothetical protein